MATAEAQTLRIYICGPVSGRLAEAKLEFAAVERELAAMGHVPVNPLMTANNRQAELEEAEFGLRAAGKPGWCSVMRKCLIDMLACDMVVMLPGWPRSRGARLERQVAMAVGIRVVEWAGWHQPSG